MAEVSPVSVQNEREIQPWQLSVEQLAGLKKQHEEEIQELQSQLQSLHGAKARFLNSKTNLDEVGHSKDGDGLLVPLNSSLYVPGKLADTNKVIVELGTGYFAEKTVNEAKELIERKLQLVAKSIESVEGVGVNKQKNLEQLTMIMNFKIQQLQQQAVERKA